MTEHGRAVERLRPVLEMLAASQLELTDKSNDTKPDSERSARELPATRLALIAGCSRMMAARTPRDADAPGSPPPGRYKSGMEPIPQQ